MPQSPFLREAEARGFIFQCTDMEALDSALLAGVVGGYIGFDLTADSLHVGSLIQIMLLRLLQKHGHRPVVLLGGGTTRIGDPSFREEARQLLDAERIALNRQGIRRNLEAMLRFGDGTADAILADNADWLDRLGYIDLLREVGVHFSVSRMLGFDSVRQRLERELGAHFPRIQLFHPAELRFPRTRPAPRGQPAAGRLGPVGQHRLRRRAGAPHRPAAGVRADHAAADHGIGCQDGQDRRGRGVAVRGTAAGVRILAVLAQYRGRRCRPLPAPVHRARDRRMRPTGCDARGRDQRGEEDPGHRGHRLVPRPRPGRGGGERRPAAVRGGRGHRRGPPPRARSTVPPLRKASRWRVCSPRWAWLRAKARHAG